MKITNKHRLPAALVAAVSSVWHWTKNRFGVTTLLEPPQILQLRQRHDDALEEDASDRIWLLIGTAVHEVLEKASINLRELLHIKN